MPSTRSLAQFLTQAKLAVRLRGQVSVLLTTDAAQRNLNRRFRGKNKPTDVLSFPADSTSAGAEKIAGDLSISVPTARRQAAQQGHSLGTEIKVLILHGLLHLAGYDHETDAGQMARRERTLRARLRLPVGLIERSSLAKPRSPSTQRKPAKGQRA
jgi:probable rRNA maturation factor